MAFAPFPARRCPRPRVLKSTQLRKDLTYFGQFGTRGLGYDVGQLAQMISDLLGTNSLQPVILVGIGNLGLALLSYRGFEKEGFEIIAAFDEDMGRKRGKNHVPIYGMDKLQSVITERAVRMAILTAIRLRRAGSGQHPHSIRHQRHLEFCAHRSGCA